MTITNTGTIGHAFHVRGECCAICQEQGYRNRLWIRTLCGHLFHRTCIQRWAAEGRELDARSITVIPAGTPCPLCRVDLSNGAPLAEEVDVGELYRRGEGERLVVSPEGGEGDFEENRNPPNAPARRSNSQARYDSTSQQDFVDIREAVPSFPRQLYSNVARELDF